MNTETIQYPPAVKLREWDPSLDTTEQYKRLLNKEFLLFIKNAVCVFAPQGTPLMVRAVKQVCARFVIENCKDVSTAIYSFRRPNDRLVKFWPVKTYDLLTLIWGYTLLNTPFNPGVFINSYKTQIAYVLKRHAENWTWYETGAEFIKEVEAAYLLKAGVLYKNAALTRHSIVKKGVIYYLHRYAVLSLDQIAILFDVEQGAIYHSRKNYERRLQKGVGLEFQWTDKKTAEIILQTAARLRARGQL